MCFIQDKTKDAVGFGVGAGVLVITAKDAKGEDRYNRSWICI
jgi:hypothetical protein